MGPSEGCAGNLKKHQISFEEEHSTDEDRFIMLGMSSGARLLVICHCERKEGSVVRIVSARKATRRESAFYQGG